MRPLWLQNHRARRGSSPALTASPASKRAATVLVQLAGILKRLICPLTHQPDQPERNIRPWCALLPSRLAVAGLVGAWIMKRILSAAAAGGLLAFWLAISPAPVSAAPMPVQVHTGASPIVNVQMTQRQKRMTRQRMMRPRMVRKRMMRGRAMRAGEPNSTNPSLPPRAQNRGQTSGGPRY